MKRSQLPPEPVSSYVVPQLRIVYVRTPKAACTSLKWLIAELNGEDPQHFRGSVLPEIARSTTIHRRALWQKTPSLHDLSDDDLAAVDPESWFIFGVVRHPAGRVWSAWQSKLLLQERRYMTRFADESWLPSVPASTSDVQEDFRRFVLALRGPSGARILRDPHFRPQAHMLTPEITPYRRIYRTAQMQELMADLREHTRAQDGPPLPDLVASNDTPLRPLSATFTDDVVEVLEEVYADDLKSFGFDSGRPDNALAASEYEPSQLAEIDRLIERSHRVGDLADHAQQLQRRNRRLAARVRKLEAQVGRSRGDRRRRRTAK